MQGSRQAFRVFKELRGVSRRLARLTRMKKEKKNSALGWMSVGMTLTALLIGVGCGILLSRNASAEPDNLFTLMMQIVLLAAAAFLQIILHESGHLIFGLLTGYHFLSFRIGSFALQKDADGKLRLKRFSLTGTGGQCLLDPPEMRDGRFPVVLYNLGGVTINVITAGLFFALHFQSRGLLNFFLLSLAAMGILFALTNGIPLRLNGMPNDGSNALSLGKDPQAMRAMWLQLRINALQTHGTRLRDMPGEWFVMPDEKALQKPLLAALGAFVENRMMDAERFDEAKAILETLLPVPTLIPVYRSLLTLDMVYLNVLEYGKDADISVLESKGMRSFCRSMHRNPTVLRTQYAVALLHDGDKDKANRIRTQFDKAIRRYPIAADIECERMLMDEAYNHA